MNNLKFNDAEKRIFLAAIAREMKECVKVDKNNPSGPSLVEICKTIQYKVTHSELWEQESI